MARIRHIAIATQNPEATAKFYKEGLGLFEAGKVDSPLAEGYYLSDGYINLAVLKYKNDDVATTEGAPRHAGIHHLGFSVDDLPEASARITDMGAKPHLEQQMEAAKRDPGSLNVELKFSGPDGVTLDLSQAGWVQAGD
jgi:glyoxylase I family protein